MEGHRILLNITWEVTLESKENYERAKLTKRGASIVVTASSHTTDLALAPPKKPLCPICSIFPGYSWTHHNAGLGCSPWCSQSCIQITPSAAVKTEPPRWRKSSAPVQTEESDRIDIPYVHHSRNNRAGYQLPTQSARNPNTMSLRFGLSSTLKCKLYYSSDTILHVKKSQRMK